MIYGNKINPERLKEARLFQKMTLEDLAIAVGINKQAISQFENRKASPDPTFRINNIIYQPVLNTVCRTSLQVAYSPLCNGTF